MEDWQVKGRREGQAPFILFLRELVGMEASFLHREMSQPRGSLSLSLSLWTQELKPEGKDLNTDELSVTTEATDCALSARRETARPVAPTSATPYGH